MLGEDDKAEGREAEVAFDAIDTNDLLILAQLVLFNTALVAVVPLVLTTDGSALSVPELDPAEDMRVACGMDASHCGDTAVLLKPDRLVAVVVAVTSSLKERDLTV